MQERRLHTQNLILEAAQGFFNQAEQEMNKGNLEGAMGILDRSIEAYTAQVPAYLLRARIHEKNKNWKGTLANLITASDYETDVETKLNILTQIRQIAELLKLLNQNELALHTLNTIISKCPPHPDLASFYSERATIYMLLGNNRLALDNAKMAIQLNPKLITPYGLCAEIYENEDPELAKEFLDQAWRLDEEEATTREARDKIRAARKNFGLQATSSERETSEVPPLKIRVDLDLKNSNIMKRSI